MDIACDTVYDRMIDTNIPHCISVDQSHNQKEITLSDLMLDLFMNKKPTMESLSNLLSNLVMNGVVLLDLEDYLKLSDGINNYMLRGNIDTNKIAASYKFNNKNQHGYLYRFNNLLYARSLVIRLVPINCYTIMLKHYLESMVEVRELFGFIISTAYCMLYVCLYRTCTLKCSAR